MSEVVKFAGALLWFVGIVFLFVMPPLGVAILLVALIISILSLVKTRQKRHDELLSATKQAAAPSTTPEVKAPEPTSPNVESRLASLKNLLDEGHISQDEYESKRKAIVDSL